MFWPKMLRSKTFNFFDYLQSVFVQNLYSLKTLLEGHRTLKSFRIIFKIIFTPLHHSVKRALITLIFLNFQFLIILIIIFCFINQNKSLACEEQHIKLQESNLQVSQLFNDRSLDLRCFYYQPTPHVPYSDPMPLHSARLVSNNSHYLYY